VEVISVNTNQSLEKQTGPELSSADDYTELVIGQINTLLASDSDADMTGLLSGSKDLEGTPDLPFNWPDDVSAPLTDQSGNLENEFKQHPDLSSVQRMTTIKRTNKNCISKIKSKLLCAL
jgi:hypothetical protein